MKSAKVCVPPTFFNSILHFSAWQYLQCSDAHSISVETKPWHPAKLNDGLTIINPDLFWILLHGNKVNLSKLTKCSPPWSL